MHAITSKAKHPTFYTPFLLALLSLFPLLIAHHYPIYLNDDSYITLTFAKNLANGNGFVFNQPPAVLGTTTPLFAILLATSSMLFPSIELVSIAIYLTAFCWLAIPWLFFLFRAEWGLSNWQAIVLALILLATGWVGFLGMEAYLFAFLLVFCSSLLLRKQYFFSGLTTGLLFLARGEGILMVAVLSCVIVARHWRNSELHAKAIGSKLGLFSFGAAIPILTWSTYAQLTFGHILPNTLSAKQAQGEAAYWQTFPTRLFFEWLPSWGERFAWFDEMPFLNLWWLVVLIGFLTITVKRQNWLVFIIWIISYIVGYTLLNISAYWWYQLPVLFVVNLIFAIGLMQLLEWIHQTVKPFSLSIAMNIVVFMGFFVTLATPIAKQSLNYKGDSRGESYIFLAQWLRENTQPTDSIAFIEIGYLGYYTDNHIIDLAGLTLPDIPAHVAQGDFAWGFWEYQPNYYLHLSDFDWALAAIVQDERFSEAYRPVTTLPGPRDNEFVIYKSMKIK